MKVLKRAMHLLLCGCFIVSGCLGMAACSDGNEDEKQPPVVDQGNLTLFPQPAEGYAGDPIPYYENGTLYVYYIHDARSWNDGYFHPWNLYTTKNFYEWKDEGRAIAGNFNDKANQDYGIGTGTVLKGHDGLYHAFYTGWNGYPEADVEFTEKVQHATSTDLLNWTKIPEDGFYGGVDDFRDPHVVWVEEEQCYWMLVSTWRGANDWTPVLKWYKSENLSDWEYNGIFYDEAENGDFMECPTLMQYNGYWYLSYFQKAVDGTNARVTRYVYKKNLSDKEWIKPEDNYFDGAGFSAARLIQCGDSLMTVGWIGTKISDYDPGLYTWAGNLAVHRLEQEADGSLKVVTDPGVMSAFSHETFYAEDYKSSGVDVSEKEISFGDSDKYRYLLYEPKRENALRLDFTVSAETKAGLTFARGDTGYGEVCIEFDFEKDIVSFFNCKPTLTGTKESQSFIKVSDSEFYRCSLLWQGECMSLYVNGEKVLSNRVYNSVGYGFGFFSCEQAASFTDIQFYE